MGSVSLNVTPAPPSDLGRNSAGNGRSRPITASPIACVGFGVSGVTTATSPSVGCTLTGPGSGPPLGRPAPSGPSGSALAGAVSARWPVEAWSIGRMLAPRL